jgi:hypothetical protein
MIEHDAKSVKFPAARVVCPEDNDTWMVQSTTDNENDESNNDMSLLSLMLGWADVHRPNY